MERNRKFVARLKAFGSSLESWDVAGIIGLSLELLDCRWNYWIVAGIIGLSLPQPAIQIFYLII